MLPRRRSDHDERTRGRPNSDRPVQAQVQVKGKPLRLSHAALPYSHGCWQCRYSCCFVPTKRAARATACDRDSTRDVALPWMDCLHSSSARSEDLITGADRVRRIMFAATRMKLLLLSTGAAAAAHVGRVPQCLYNSPEPARVNITSGTWAVAITDPDGITDEPMPLAEVHLRLAASNLRTALNRTFGVQLLPDVYRTSSLPLSKLARTPMILLGLPNHDEYLARLLEGRDLMREGGLAAELGEEGYLIDIQTNTITIAAISAAGVIAGTRGLVNSIVHINGTGEYSFLLFLYI
eukprot:SAG31_NODE_574_length_13967_cov_7.512042_2_plen_294_part_00